MNDRQTATTLLLYSLGAGVFVLYETLPYAPISQTLELITTMLRIKLVQDIVFGLFVASVAVSIPIALAFRDELLKTQPTQ